MKKASSVIATVVAAAAAVTAGAAVPAVAGAHSSAASATGAVGAPASPTPAAGTGGATVKSTSFAGYGYQGGGEGSFNVSATVVVPKVKCSSAFRAIAASVGVYNASNGFSAADVVVGCKGGKAFYFPSLEVNTTTTKPRGKNYTKDHVRPGDKVKLEVSQTPSKVTVSVIDTSRKKIHVSRHGAGSPSGSGPWVGDVAVSAKNGKLRGVPNFGTTRFSGARLGKTPFGSAFPARYNRYSKKGTLQIKTSTFAKNHKSFKTIFKHS